MARKTKCPFKFKPFRSIKEDAELSASDSDYYRNNDTTVEQMYESTKNMLERVCEKKKVFRGMMVDDPEEFAKKIEDDDGNQVMRVISGKSIVSGDAPSSSVA